MQILFFLIQGYKRCREEEIKTLEILILLLFHAKQILGIAFVTALEEGSSCFYSAKKEAFAVISAKLYSRSGYAV